MDSDGHQGVGPDERCQQPEHSSHDRLHRVLQRFTRPHGPHARVYQLAESRFNLDTSFTSCGLLSHMHFDTDFGTQSRLNKIVVSY